MVDRAWPLQPLELFGFVHFPEARERFGFGKVLEQGFFVIHPLASPLGRRYEQRRLGMSVHDRLGALSQRLLQSFPLGVDDLLHGRLAEQSWLVGLLFDLLQRSLHRLVANRLANLLA